MLTYLSVCSGIEAASVAWHHMGWRPVGFSEIEKFPSAVLAHHYPDTPNYGDMTTLAKRVLTGEIEAPDVLVGGTPCQAFSVAGLRAGLADPRGALTLAFQRLADAIDHVRRRAGKPACTIVWENVPGVLSSRDNAFGCFLGAMVGEESELQPPGKRWADAGAVFGPERAAAWRVLDAQYFGLAQRRRRVFVVASAGTIDPCAVLFELDSVRRDTAPSREARKDAASGAGCGTAYGGGRTGGGLNVAATLTAKGNRQDFEVETFIAASTVGGWPSEVAPTLTVAFGAKQGIDNQHLDAQRGGHFVPGVAHSLRGEGFDASEDGTGRGTPLVAVAFHANAQADKLPTAGRDTSITDALTCSQNAAVAAGTVRRLTPRECERLQGFPDDYTAIPWRGKDADQCPDGPRYKALGNSMAVPVMRWIGERVHAIHPAGFSAP